MRASMYEMEKEVARENNEIGSTVVPNNQTEDIRKQIESLQHISNLYSSSSRSAPSCVANSNTKWTESTAFSPATLILEPRPDEILQAVRNQSSVFVVPPTVATCRSPYVVEFHQSGFVGQDVIDETGASADKLETSNKTSKRQRRKRDSFKITSSREQSDDDAYVPELKVHAGSRKKFVCKDCPKTYTSQKGLDYHVETKHRESETVCSYDCEHCGKTYMSLPGLKYHLQHNHIPNSYQNTDKVVDEEIEVETKQSPGQLGSRKSALRALRLLSQVVDQKDEHPSNSKVTCDRSKKTCNKPLRVKKVSEAEAADIQATQTPFMSVSTKNWKEVFTPEQLVEVEKMRTKGSSLRCLNKDCKKSFTTPVGFAYHHQRCGKSRPQILCEICHAVYSSQGGLDYHMRVVHAPKDLVEEIFEDPTEARQLRRCRSAAQDHDWSGANITTDDDDDDEDNNDDNEDDDDIGMESQSGRKEQKQCHISEEESDDDICPIFRQDWQDSFSGKASVPDSTSSRKKGKCRITKLLTADPRAKVWMQDSRSRLSSDCVLAEMMPQAASWIPIPPGEALAYLPIATQSPPFTIKDSEKRKRYKNLGTRAKGIDMEVESGQPTNTSGEESTPIDEKQHQLQLFDSCVTSLHGDDSLVFNVGGAVCAMDWLLQPQDSECLIEYCAVSTHRSTEESHSVGRAFEGKGAIQLWAIDDSNVLSAHMDVAIAHSWGCIWDLKWCPQSFQYDQHQHGSENGWERLGILAMACSTGEVQLLNIPHPSHLKQSQSSAIYHVQPMLTLIPGSFGCLATGQHGQAWCVCWRPDQGHSQLAAGFSDGSVAVWQVNTRCPWLSVKPSAISSDKKTTVLLPIQHFPAHVSVVRCLCWSAVDTNIIVTAAHGRDSAVRVWNLCDVSSPVQDFGQSSGWVYEMQWLTYWNVIALVGDLSLVSSIKQHAELISLDKLHHKAQASFRTAISLRNSPYLSVSFSDWNNTLAFSCADGTVSICILPSLVASLVPMDGDWNLFNVTEELSPDSKTVSIVFEDFNSHDFSLKSSSNPGKQELGVSNAVLLSPLSAVNKVQWNPNYRHRLWLLSGCRSGLVRLTQVTHVTALNLFLYDWTTALANSQQSNNDNA